MMGNRTDRFENETPIKVIRNRAIVIGGVLMALIALIEFICIPLVALKIEEGRIMFCSLFGFFGALMAVVSALVLLVRVEVYENGFAERGPQGEGALYSECVSKTPVYADNIFKGRKELHHYIIHKTDGSDITLAKWMLKPELTGRIGLDELPVRETKIV